MCQSRQLACSCRNEESAQSSAGFLQIGIGLREAEPQQISSTPAEKGFSRYASDTGVREQIHGLILAIASRERRNIGQDVIGALWPGGSEPNLFQSCTE